MSAGKPALEYLHVRRVHHVEDDQLRARKTGGPDPAHDTLEIDHAHVGMIGHELDHHAEDVGVGDGLVERQRIELVDLPERLRAALVDVLADLEPAALPMTLNAPAARALAPM